jgi:4-amino-4-deoxy-L-arabinose transferase-like glycosyltransferase
MSSNGAESELLKPGPRTFRWWLLGIAAVAFAIRAIYTFTISPPLAPISDDSFYYYASNLLAQGHGFSDPFAYFFQGRLTPTAAHPPLWPLILAGFSVFTGPTSGVGTLTGAAVDVHRLVGCGFGALTVVLVGILGRRIGGWRVGLLAAALASIYPHFITVDGYLLAEPLYAALVGGLLIVAYDFARRPSRVRALALGVLVGLAALTRQEALLFVPVLTIPLAWRSGPRRLVYGGLALLGTVAVVAPWTIRNYVVFHRFVPVANTTGAVVAGANCRLTYYGPDLGSWQPACVVTPNPSSNEAVEASRRVSQGAGYAEGHPARAVLIAGIRLLRIWSLYAPNDQAIGNLTVLWIGTVLYWCLLVAAIAAVVIMRRLKRPLLVLVAAPIVTSIAAVFGDGLDRLRYGAEVPLLVLAAWTLVLLGTRSVRLRTATHRLHRVLVAPRRDGVVHGRP